MKIKSDNSFFDSVYSFTTFVEKNVRQVASDLGIFKCGCAFYLYFNPESKPVAKIARMISEIRGLPGYFTGQSFIRTSMKCAAKAETFFQNPTKKNGWTAGLACTQAVRQGCRFALWLKRQAITDLYVNGWDLGFACSKTAGYLNLFIRGNDLYEAAVAMPSSYEEASSWVDLAVKTNSMAITLLSFYSFSSAYPLLFISLESVNCVYFFGKRIFSSKKEKN